MKKLFLLLTVLLAATVAKADDAAIKCLLPNGSTHYFMMEDDLLVKFVDESLVITSKTQNISVNLTEGGAVQFAYIIGSTGIREMKDSHHPIYRITDDFLEASYLDACSNVYLYDTKGVAITTAKVSSDGTIKLPIRNMGVYIVKTSVSTFKIKK